MNDLPIPTREQIRAYFEGTTCVSEEYVKQLIETCHTVLVEMRKEQQLREQNPHVQALYEEYRRAINLVHNNG